MGIETTELEDKRDMRDLFAFIVLVLIVFSIGFYSGLNSSSEYARALDKQMGKPELTDQIIRELNPTPTPCR